MLPLDTSIQAEYEDGFVLDETELEDVNPYTSEGNTFTAILKKHPEADHGRMVRFSCFWKDRRYDVDWTTLPDNARPIRFRHGFSTIDQATGDVLASGWTGMDFGYQFNDEDGANQQEVLELR